MTKKKAAKPTKFQKLVTSIERTNRSFKKAGQAKRIVMVAEDVLMMLRLKRLDAVTGVYVGLPRTSPRTASHDGLKDVSEFLKLPKIPACEVCAIGAAMVASTMRLDNVPIQYDHHGAMSTDAVFTPHLLFVEQRQYRGTLSGNMSQRALDVFPKALLRAMEDAFERGGSHGYEIYSDTARLRAIYQNLIKNKGKKFTDRQDGSVVWPE